MMIPPNLGVGMWRMSGDDVLVDRLAAKIRAI